MKKTSAFLNLVVVLSMVLAMVATTPMVATAQQTPPPPTPSPKDGLLDDLNLQIKKAETGNPIDKIDPSLREAAQKRGSEEVMIYATVRKGVDLSKFMTNMIVRPEILPGMHNVYGKTTADKLLAIAARSGVIAVVNVDFQLREKPVDGEKPAVDQAAATARLQQLRQSAVPFAETKAAKDIGGSGWFDVLDGHKSKAAWDKGFTGQGVVVGVLDDGVDFAHPDLQGTYAVVTDPASPYYGWPMSFSQISMLYFVNDVQFGTSYIANGANATRWSDTRTTVPVPTCAGCTTGTLNYKPVGSPVHTYTIPLTSKSGKYKVGTHHDKNLLAAFGERVAILVVDEHTAGVYDTVYVDLDDDYDFTNEKPVTKDSPEVYRDLDDDGYNDISGGLLVWISDGANVPPTADWLWGLTCGSEVGSQKACPNSGELLIFTGPFDAGYSHGTQCASNVAGQGVVSGGASAPSFHIGGMVQGAAQDVKVMDFSNHYASASDEDEFIVAGLGYDGIPDSGDEVQIASNSYGNFTQMWGGWGYIGRVVTMLNLTLAPSTMWVFSGGNEGPGYGPQEGDAGPTIIKAGTSTQFGSTNWDSIASIEQIVYGDPSSFGAKGPNRDGSSGLDLLGNGGRGAGDEALNYYGFNGAESWATWGGTSRSAPVIAGNLSLLYQAYKDKHGEWPTWEEVMAIAKSSANDSVSSPFLQGAGVFNADRATDVASGAYGVYASPDEWQVGDWEGVDYLNFAKVAYPGSTDTQTYEVVNPSDYDITVDLSDGVMQRTGEQEFTFTTSDSAGESGFNFHSPDYLMELDSALIPADTEVMVVRYTQPYSSYDPVYDFTPNANNSWRFMFYNWTDVNGDGKLWEDANGNGAVNHENSSVVDNDGFFQVDYTDPGTEIQQGEYVRMDYQFGGVAIPIFVHDPLERMSDGYFFGFQHRNNDFTVPQTTFKIRVEFYKRADWSWLSLDKSSLVVPANSTATFDATADIPADAAAGIYEGVIYMQDPGDANHAAHESALPVVVNVIHDLANDPDGAVHLGNGPRQDTLYQNSWTNGYFNWYGGGWTGAGDWRHYFFNVDQADVDKDSLLIHTFWNDIYPTDINTFVLGPTADCASNGVEPCAAYSWLLQPDPSIYGPYTLQPIAGSSPFISTAAYPFDTSTGGPDDWLMAPLSSEGLHEIALHNVLFSGKTMDAQFGVDVGTIGFDPAMDPADGYLLENPMRARLTNETGKIDLRFTPSLAIPDIYATLAPGLSTTTSPWKTTFVPDNGGVFSAYDPDNVAEPVIVDVPGTSELYVYVDMPTGIDADLFVVYDADENGVANADADFVVGQSGNSTGEAEEIIVEDPSLGQYLVVFAGYAMGGGHDLDWYYEITAPGELPVTDNVIVSEAITVTQAANPADHTSGAAYPFVATERTHALHATLTGIPDGSNVDLYLTDGSGTVVASSVAEGNADEALDLFPAEGEYRLTAGETYTLYVLGYAVTGSINPTLDFWADDLSIWLGPSGHADVHVNEIAAGETITLTLNYDFPGMVIGDEYNARVVAGPSVMPGALSKEINFLMVDADPSVMPPDFSATVSKTVTGVRGDTTYGEDVGLGFPIDYAPIAPGDVVVFTVSATNTSPFDAWLNLWDYWTNTSWDWVGFDGAAPDYAFPGVGSGACGSSTRECVDMYHYVQAGETVTFKLKLQKTATTGNGVAGSLFMNYVQLYWTNDTFSEFVNLGMDGAGGVLGSLDQLPELSYKDAPTTVAPGEIFTYTIHLNNPTFYTPNVFMQDALPSSVTLQGGKIAYGGGTLTSNTAGTIIYWYGQLPLSGAEIKIRVKAKTSLVDGTQIINEAALAASSGGEPFAYLSTSSTVYDGTDPDLMVDKQVDQKTGDRGDVLGYTITVTNYGTETADTAEVFDELPEHLLVLPETLTATLGTATLEDGAVVWTGDLAAGGSVVISYQAEIDAGAPDGYVLINKATASAANMPFTGYDSALSEVVLANPDVLAPSLIGDSAETEFNTPVTLPNVVANDIAYGWANSVLAPSVDLDPSTAGQQTEFTDADGNEWALNLATGAVLFTPAEDFAGEAITPYAATDRLGQTGTAQLTVMVHTPDFPEAADDETTTAFNTPVTLTNITANDTVYGTNNGFVLDSIDLSDTTPGTQTAVTDAHGNHWQVNPTTGDVLFTPANNFTGEASIEYFVADQDYQFASAKLVVYVEMPAAPTAADDTVTVYGNGVVTLTNITANDTAHGTGNSIVINTIDLDPATAGQQTSFTDADGNTWQVNTTTGAVTFTSEVGFAGTASITYSVEDEVGQVATAHLSVEVKFHVVLLPVVINK